MNSHNVSFFSGGCFFKRSFLVFALILLKSAGPGGYGTQTADPSGRIVPAAPRGQLPKRVSKAVPYRPAAAIKSRKAPRQRLITIMRRRARDTLRFHFSQNPSAATVILLLLLIGLAAFMEGALTAPGKAVMTAHLMALPLGMKAVIQFAAAVSFSRIIVTMIVTAGADTTAEFYSISKNYLLTGAVSITVLGVLFCIATIVGRIKSKHPPLHGREGGLYLPFDRKPPPPAANQKTIVTGLLTGLAPCPLLWGVLKMLGGIDRTGYGLPVVLAAGAGFFLFFFWMGFFLLFLRKWTYHRIPVSFEGSRLLSAFFLLAAGIVNWVLAL